MNSFPFFLAIWCISVIAFKVFSHVLLFAKYFGLYLSKSANVDFPAPLEPTIATVSPLIIFILIFLSEGFSPKSYLNETSLKLILLLKLINSVGFLGFLIIIGVSNIENTLSDNLHESLTNRFVDISATYFVNIKNKGENPKIEVDDDNSIKLNGQIYGYIDGFQIGTKLSHMAKMAKLQMVQNSPV